MGLIIYSIYKDERLGMMDLCTEHKSNFLCCLGKPDSSVPIIEYSVINSHEYISQNPVKTNLRTLRKQMISHLKKPLTLYILLEEN